MRTTTSPPALDVTGLRKSFGDTVALDGIVLTAVADSAINSALTTTLPPGSSFGTLDLKVNFLRSVTPDGRDLVARATVEQRGRTVAVSTCRIDDAGGKRVAMATGSAMISDGRGWPTPLDD